MINTFVVSQFSCCPIVWMFHIFHGRSVNKKISKVYERAVRITYKDSCSNCCSNL